MARLSDRTVAEVAPGVFRLGTTLTGFYLLEEGGRFTMVDGAFPGYWNQLEGFLQSRGVGIEAIEAQVLTHHHPDHRGMTERVRRETGGLVWVHSLDRDMIDQRQAPQPAPIWRPKVFRAFAHMLRHGIIRTPPVLQASTFEDGETLDVPGRPVVVHVPGHTPGNSALTLDGTRAVITGDSLITIDIYTWNVRPCITADFFNDDSRLALDSLTTLEGLDSDLVLPGHGPVWRGPVADAARSARDWGIY